jgi:cytochrome c-type biogenesis protein
MNVSVGLAFLAGLASFFSPCVFSLIPAYIGYLSGRSLNQTETSITSLRLNTFLHGLFFVLGFSFVFITLGIAISALSQLFFNARDILAKIGGVVMILFGLHLTGLIRIPFLDFDVRLQSKNSNSRSLISSFVMGIFFSAGWSPCVGPTLGLILTLAVQQAHIGRGVLLLSFYSLGMAVPFLAAAFGVGWVTNILKKYVKAMKITQIVIGVILIIVGIMLFLGIYQRLITFESLIDFGI